MSAVSDAMAQIPLNSFLKALTSNGVPVSKAMAAAGKIYKKYNTRAALEFLTDFDLKSAGVDEKETRKLILAALKKAGYKSATAAGPSRPSSSTTVKASGVAATARKKRKTDSNLNELLPDRAAGEEHTSDSLNFNEELNEEVLKSKSVVINRAPIMAAWAFVVAERLGFQREEALSIASVYTEMNAISKGVSLGIYDKSKGKGVEASTSGSQPYVDLMGRRPLLKSSSQQWRAVSSGSPVSPAAAFSYIKRSLRQTTPYIVGTLRLLALSFTPKDLNDRGFSLYAEFRPEVGGWGQKGEVKCKTILDLRQSKDGGGGGIAVAVPSEEEAEQSSSAVVKVGELRDDKIEGVQSTAMIDVITDEPDRKKARVEVEEMSEDEYDAVLDADELTAIDLQGLP